MKIITIISMGILMGLSGVRAADMNDQPGYNPATNGVWNVSTNSWRERHGARTNVYNENGMKWSEASTNAFNDTNAPGYANTHWQGYHNDANDANRANSSDKAWGATNSYWKESNMWHHGAEEMSHTNMWERGTNAWERGRTNAWNRGTNAWNRTTNSWAH